MRTHNLFIIQLIIFLFIIPTDKLYVFQHHTTPWEEEGHKCKNNISETLAIKALKEASKVYF